MMDFWVEYHGLFTQTTVGVPLVGTLFRVGQPRWGNRVGQPHWVNHVGARWGNRICGGRKGQPQGIAPTGFQLFVFWHRVFIIIFLPVFPPTLI